MSYMQSIERRLRVYAQQFDDIEHERERAIMIERRTRIDRREVSRAMSRDRRMND